MLSPFFLANIFFSTFFIFSLFSVSFSQSIDEEEFLDRLERVEKNISDLQKGQIGNIEDKLTSGYISRNESRLDKIETKNIENFGLLERSENKLFELEKRLELINTDLTMRIKDIESLLEQIKEGQIISKNNNIAPVDKFDSKQDQEKNLNSKNNYGSNNLNIDAKAKYENAIKLLWSNNYDEALNELQELKEIKPDDLMPNIQYWLGEVFYAKKNFNQAILEFGEGLKNYPDSIKGPDNMLKLGLSFSNLSKKIEACNVLVELEIKYPDSSKDVLQRGLKEREKLDCDKE